MSNSLPSAPDAEINLVGSIWLQPEVAQDVAAIVSASDFADDALRILYDRSMSRLTGGKRIDLTLLVEDLRTYGELDRVGGLAYLGTVADSVVNPAHASYYACQIREASQRRQLIEAADIVRRSALTGEPIESIVATAEKRLRTIDEQGAPLAISSAMDAAREGISRVYAAKEGRGGTGVASGFFDFDRLTGGWHAGELIIPAARPGDGKTTFAMQTAVHVAEHGKRVLYATVEMGAADLALRQIAGDAAVSLVDIRTGDLTDAEVDRLTEEGDKFGKLPLYLLDAPRCSVADIRRAARQLQRVHRDLGLIVADYIGLLSASETRLPRHEQVSHITRDLKALARDLALPVIALCQLNRGSEGGKGMRPKLSNLRESGSIEQDADVVLFLYRPESANPDDPDLTNLTELIVAKNRSGPTGQINLRFDGKQTRFSTPSADLFAAAF